MGGKPRSKLKKDLDRVFSIYIRRRDNWTCVVCGRTDPNHGEATSSIIDCGHLITRKKDSTRWDEKNCHAQCRNCNNLHRWQPHHYTKAFLRRYGRREYEALCARAAKPAHFKASDIKEMIEDYLTRIA